MLSVIAKDAFDFYYTQWVPVLSSELLGRCIHAFLVQLRSLSLFGDH
jgi:hypothetical protein